MIHDDDDGTMILRHVQCTNARTWTPHHSSLIDTDRCSVCIPSSTSGTHGVLGATHHRVCHWAGVFFRVFTQEVAQGLGVRGYVRNEPVCPIQPASQSITSH